MFYLRLLLFWGVALSLLTVVSSITIGFLEFLPGLFLMWLIYYLFVRSALNTIKKVKTNFELLPEVIHSSSLIPALLALAYIIFFPLYIKFYTGQSITAVIFNLVHGNSNYQNYQSYFSQQNLAALTLIKIPFILGSGILKFLFIATVCRILGYKRHINWIEVLSIIVMIFVTILLSLSRGTSFEFFELIMIFVFGTLLRRRRFYQKNWFTKKSMLLLAGIALLLMMILGYNINLRGDFSCATDQLCFENNTWLAELSPILGRLTFQLSGYFLFGLYFTSTALLNISISSISGFFALLFPSGLSLFLGQESYAGLVCGKMIDCRAAWIPDIVLQITTFGLLGVLVFSVILGTASARLFSGMLKGSIFSAVLLYFTFIYMISLPVGNFIASSSSNIISIFCAVGFKKFPFMGKLLINYFKVENQ